MVDARLDYRVLNDEHSTPWHDGPIIGVLYVVRAIARQSGYAVGWHGSVARDLDLIAVPWTEDADPPERLVARIMEAVGGAYTHGQENPSRRPHGRLSYAINLHPGPFYIDLSVMPPREPA